MNSSEVIPSELQCESMTEPLGVDSAVPCLSWKLTDPNATRGQRQTAFQVLAASKNELLEPGKADLWESGKVVSSQSTLVPFDGRKLVSNQDCYWKVRVFDKNGKPSAWSQVARFSIGLLKPDDWKGSWIKHPTAPAVKHLWFRKSFDLDQPVTTAFIHVASVGYHELYVNGKKVDDRVLAPALSRLDKRVLYVTYDIAPLLRPGKNVIALWTGPGWARYSYFKTQFALRVQLNAQLANATNYSLASDPSWRCQISSSENTGQTQYKDNGGEKFDARSYLADWNSVDFDDRHWPEAVKAPIHASLSAQMMDPTRIIETVSAKAVTGNGPTYKVDLGKNFVGWLEIKFHGQAPGDVVTIKIADDNGTVQDFGQRSQYVCKGEEGEAFKNRFNFSAGRYVTLEGVKSKPQLEDVRGYAVATDLKRVGHFNCSKELFNQIYEADLWTYRCNTVQGYTMDCATRERLGYGEECFATAWAIGLPNYDASAFYRKHVRDWADVQEPNGWINHTAPQINEHFGGPIWSSAGLNISWEDYLNFGDPRVLTLTYASSKRWLEFLATHTKDGLLQNYAPKSDPYAWGKFLGDWAAPGPRKERGDSPDALFFNNCVYAMNLETFIALAEVLEKPQDAALYRRRLQELRGKIHRAFFHPKTNSYCSGTQVQLAFALLTGITPAHLRPAVAANIENDLKQTHPYLDMGSSGLPVLLKYLLEKGERGDLLFQPLSKTTQPSYGYFLSRGENTWPEYWQVNVPSRIHTCYTGIAAWFTKSLAGIRPDPEHPGFRKFLIKPVVSGDLSFAEASTESPYGQILSRWERNGTTLHLKVTIPPNSTATVFVPTSNAKTVTESGKPVADSPGLKKLENQGHHAVFEAKSGQYDFASELGADWML